MKICVALPTKNEISSIQEMIDRIKKFPYDIIIVDENSKDGTIEIAKKNKIPVYQREGKGKGCGVQTAFKIARKKGYDVLVLIDCDCTYPPEYIPQFIGYLKDYDMVVGRRSMKNIPAINRLPNIFHTLLVNLLFFSNLKDINSGLRAFKLDKFPSRLDAKKFDIEAQITTLALKNRLKIKEIPIKYKKRKGRSKIKIKDGFIISWRIVKERLRK